MAYNYVNATIAFAEIILRKQKEDFAEAIELFSALKLTDFKDLKSLDKETKIKISDALEKLSIETFMHSEENYFPEIVDTCPSVETARRNLVDNECQMFILSEDWGREFLERKGNLYNSSDYINGIIIDRFLNDEQFTFEAFKNVVESPDKQVAYAKNADPNSLEKGSLKDKICNAVENILKTNRKAMINLSETGADKKVITDYAVLVAKKSENYPVLKSEEIMLHFEEVFCEEDSVLFNKLSDYVGKGETRKLRRLLWKKSEKTDKTITEVNETVTEVSRIISNRKKARNFRALYVEDVIKKNIDKIIENVLDLN